jgi:hypothetical protein
VYLESKNYREVEVLGSSGDPSGWKQVRVSTAALDTDACQHEMIWIKKENSSGSLPPVVSMMQATEAREEVSPGVRVNSLNLRSHGVLTTHKALF